MDLYIFCVVLGAAGMAAMALLGFTSSHTGGHAHATGRGHITASLDHAAWSWKHIAWSWLSPRVLFNFFVGFGGTGLVVERLVGPVLALPVAVIGGIAFESLVVRPIFNSLFRFESQPAQ